MSNLKLAIVLISAAVGGVALIGEIQAQVRNFRLWRLRRRVDRLYRALPDKGPLQQPWEDHELDLVAMGDWWTLRGRGK